MLSTSSDNDTQRPVGLVLEGGGLRGIFTAGVLDYFMEMGLSTSYVVGSSSGACCLLGYLSHQIGYVRKGMIQREDNKLFYSLNQLIRLQKIIDLDKIFNEYPYRQNPFDFDTFFASPIEHEIVVTNCADGTAEYLSEPRNSRRLSAISKASSSMPLFTRTVSFEGREYMSGSVSDPIPIQRALSKGFFKNIAVLTRREGHFPEMTTYQKLLYEVAYRKYPALLAAMLRRKETYLNELKILGDEENAGRAFVLRPEMPEIRRLETDYDVLISYYNHGYETARKHWKELESFLSC